MVESSKILTVSYGTFSCTLEGFDDSFSTMKAIAEYFRDLAAGDRYFGAEPPTPDAEMLTRIAEREISRRVEMRSSTTGIVLRASEPDPGASMPQVADTPVAAPQPQVEPAQAAPEKAPAPQVADLLQPANAAAAADIETLTPKAEADETPVAVQDPAPAMPPAPRPPQQRPAVARAAELARASAEDADVADDTAEVAADTRPDVTAAPPRTVVPAHPDADSVAAKLQRIRAVVGGVPLATPSAYAEDQDDAGGDGMGLSAPTSPKAEPTPGDTVQSREGTADIDVAPAATGTDPVPLPDAGADDALDAADGNDGDPSRDRVDDAAEQDAAKVETDGDAVTSAEEITNSATTDEASEDAATDATDDTDDQISAVLRNLRRAGLRQTPRDQAVAAPVAAATPDDGGDTAPRDADAAANPTPVVAPVVRPAAPRGRILRVTRRPRDPEAAIPPQPSTAPAPAAVTPATPAPSQAAFPEAPADDNAPATSETSAAAIVPDAPAADETRTDDTPSSSHEDDFADSVAARDGAEDLMDFDPDTIESTLSEDDEADLQRELAALAAEQEAAQVLRAATAPAETDADHAAAQDDAHPKARRDPLPGTSEAEMSRIMSQADDELADPEASRRRNAIAHLKAAVAATEAARQLGEPKSDRATTEDVFRDDLQKVVQPRRASRPEAATERSERPRPAPLKLVASQRIDLVDTAPAEPVQPRRIATPAAAATTAHDVGNFAEFAAQMGATSLQDLLEAAAAYTAFVEGSEDFSRPHIMQKVKQTVAEDFSREDGLRSFGTLLRQGRIERVRNGRFAVSARTRFRPESMVAGG